MQCRVGAFKLDNVFRGDFSRCRPFATTAGQCFDLSTFRLPARKCTAVIYMQKICK